MSLKLKLTAHKCNYISYLCPSKEKNIVDTAMLSFIDAELLRTNKLRAHYCHCSSPSDTVLLPT